MKTRNLVFSAVLAALCAQASFGQATTANDPATRHTQMLTQMLGLSSDQQTKVQAILTSEENTTQANRTTMQGLRASLLAAIKTNDSNGINSYTMQMSPLQQQDETARALAAAQVYALLNADQQTKVGNNIEMLGGMGGGRGPGGPPNGKQMMRRGGGPR